MLDSYLSKKGLSLQAFHADTTDKTVYGAYESASLEALQITHGYNRHHHWQKQIGFGLVGNEDGIPFYSDVHDDNRSDKVWNPEVLSRIHEQFKQAKIDDEWIYVADSAAMTKDTLAQTKAARAFLITRGPSSLWIVKQALAGGRFASHPVEQTLYPNGEKRRHVSGMGNGLDL